MAKSTPRARRITALTCVALLTLAACGRKKEKATEDAAAAAAGVDSSAASTPVDTRPVNPGMGTVQALDRARAAADAAAAAPAHQAAPAEGSSGSE